MIKPHDQAPVNLPHSPAAERNRAPILAHLLALLPPTGRALEIASGTGQHAAHFAAALPGWRWQPTDADDTLFAAVEGWARQIAAPNVQAPRRLNVLDADWPSDGGPPFGAPFDLIYAANLLHISPWACTPALMQGAGRQLAPGGRLVTYGPYLEDEVPTTPGNLAFDADLRARNPAWGIRRLADVAQQARRAGLALQARHAMPANNLLLVFGRD